MIEFQKGQIYQSTRGIILIREVEHNEWWVHTVAYGVDIDNTNLIYSFDAWGDGIGDSISLEKHLVTIPQAGDDYYAAKVAQSILRREPQKRIHVVDLIDAKVVSRVDTRYWSLKYRGGKHYLTNLTPTNGYAEHDALIFVGHFIQIGWGDNLTVFEVV
jgi:hypothetical protein